MKKIVITFLSTALIFSQLSHADDLSTDGVGSAAEASVNASTNSYTWQTVGWVAALVAVVTLGIVMVAQHPGHKV